MIERSIFKTLQDHFFDKKAIVIIGPRQTGKTTLLRKLASTFGEYLYLDGDDATTRQTLTDPSYERLNQLIGDHRIVFVDEAQRIGNAGITLKMMIDRFPQVQLLVSGSSALEMGDTINESLTGRKWEFQLLPISWEEWQKHTDFLTVQQQLENRLVFGMYPDVLNRIGNERGVLKDLASSYLYKDILALSGIKKPEILEKLVVALALQCGSEVNLTEVGQLLGVDKNTVSAYIDLLEKVFIVFRLPALSRNVRNEIKKNQKIYFYDNGIRNAIINNLNPISLRQDKGILWENFLMSERLKRNNYHRTYAKSYFWRTTQQQEIDLIEEVDGNMKAYEFKWKQRSKVKIPSAFAKAYESTFDVITPDNFTEFLIPSPTK
ncbi:MAG: ATP-binding protein [Flavobacteriales bacterium]|nr:ATP-binding protein [Flavobacteriales bacterium]